MQQFDENFSLVRDLSWYSMCGMKDIECYYSGDITTDPNGASEFIDLIIKIPSKIGRYAVVLNDVYSCDSFSEIPECFTGVMFREKPNSGEIFKHQL